MKYIVFIVFFVSCIIAQELIVEKQKEFSVEIDPNLYSSTFSINMEEFDQSIIENNFEKSIQITNKFNICKGGKYTINPHYKRKSFVGYISFNCRFTQKDIYEELLSQIKKLRGKLSQNRIQLANNSEALEEAREKLETMALVFPKEYSHFLKQNLQADRCFVDKIIFNNMNRGISPYMLSSNESLRKTKVSVPIEEKLKHTLRTNYIFKCIY
jgi:hypothetical protein